MFETAKESLMSWHARNGERAKMQHAYIVIAVVLLVVAGIIGLMNHGAGQSVLMVAILSAAMFLANAVVWSLLQSAVLTRIPTRRKPTGRKK